MSEAIQTKQRSEPLRDGLATMVAAGLLAVSMACMAEGLLMLWGALLGEPEWHRSGVDQRLAASIAWLAGVPILGPLVAWLGSPSEWLPSNGYMRNLFVFGLACFPWMLVPGRRLGPTLIARYDGEMLRPSPTEGFGLRCAGPTGDAQVDAWQRLHTWCFAGAGTGRSPFWRPGGMPDVPQLFSIAVLTGGNGVGKSQLAEALGRALDGTLQLQARTSRFGALRLRLRVKYDNCRWWRSRQDSDPWDSGYLVQDPVAWARLAVFAPRRATLIVADEWPPQSLVAVIEALSARRSNFRHPVRLLLISAVWPAPLGLRRDADRAVWSSAVQELGEVPVIDMSKVHCGPPPLCAGPGASAPASAHTVRRARSRPSS